MIVVDTSKGILIIKWDTTRKILNKESVKSIY